MKLPRVHRMTKGGTLYKWHRVTRAPLPTDIPEDHPDFIAAWNAEEAKKTPDRSRATKGTIGAAWEGLKATAAFRGYSAVYRAQVVRHGDAIATLYGKAPMADLRDYHIRKDLEKLDAHPAIARLKTWRLICAHAREANMTRIVATDGVAKPKAAPVQKRAAWDEGEVARYRAKWAIGTPQRLCFELLYWTGARTNDAVRLTPSMVSSDGLLRFRQSKTGHDALVPWTSALPAWAEWMEADREILHQCLADRRGFTFLEVNGRVRSFKGLSNLISRAAEDANIIGKTAHGLRATRLTLIAESGGPAHAIMTWGGHKTLSEAEGYTREADRRKVLLGTERNRNPVNRSVNQT